MILKVYNFWQILKANFWFVPALFCLAFMGLTIIIYALENAYWQNITLPDYIFQGTTDDAKSVVITLLSTMITMATLAISITIVVLSLAASQLGPRLIKTFMADYKTKNFIGLFFGTVIACFVLTVILHSRASEAITPQITISLVFMLCLVNLFVLLGFVHHVAQSCIADNVILKVAEELKNALGRLANSQSDYLPGKAVTDKDLIDKEVTDKDRSDKGAKQSISNAKWLNDPNITCQSIFFQYSGYVQNIDYDEIITLAERENLRLEIDFKAGHFLVKGEAGFRVYSPTGLSESIEKELRNCFIIGATRTPTQDIEYSIRHLVEIAVRALSPGINDSFTAMHVLDHLSSALVILFEKETPATDFYDSKSVKRMQAAQNDEADIIFSALEQVRYNGRAMPSIIRHLLEKIAILAEIATKKKSKVALLEQVKCIQYDLQRFEEYIPELDALKRRANFLIKELS